MNIDELIRRQHDRLARRPVPPEPQTFAEVVVRPRGDSPLTHYAALLAHDIRRDPARRHEFNYPPRMELATTCCCHIVVDDPNYEDSSALFCLERAREERHPNCIALAEILVGCTRTQRKRINYLAWFGDDVIGLEDKWD